jgi:hypothetical protein
MRALGFCVSVEHARFMAERFSARGLRAEALDASTPADLRQAALRRLQSGELQILFAVDLFNEGLDIPSIDTVLLLRPTESAVVFLQQLGRGLRLSPDTGKSCLTVLDFIGQQHRLFRFDLRYRALLGCSRRQLEDQLAQGFPFLPPGCRLVLDRVASERVLANLRQCLPSRLPQLLQELRSLAAEGVIGPASGLAHWLDALAMEPADFYGIRGAGFTALRRELGWLPPHQAGPPHPEEERLSRAFARLLHLDDPDRLRATAAALAASAPPDPEALAERERRQWGMLTASIRCPGRCRCRCGCTAAIPAPRSKRPLVCSPTTPPGSTAKACCGTNQASATDLLFITLRKSEALFSPSTRYRDLALGPTLFHWESQSTTTAASPTGQRYIHHAARGSRVLLFVREQRKQDGRPGGPTEPFVCLGFATYEGHEGERPMAIRWRLERQIPAAWLPGCCLA